MLFSLLICTPPFFYDGLFRAQDVSGRLSCRGCGTFHHVLCRLQLGPEARSRAGGSVARLAVMPYSHGRLALSGQLCFCEVSGHPCPLPGSAHRFTLVSFPLTRGDAVARSPFPSCAVCLPGPARQGKRSRRAAPFIYHFRVVAADEVAVLNVFEPTDLNVFVNFDYCTFNPFGQGRLLLWPPHFGRGPWWSAVFDRLRQAGSPGLSAPSQRFPQGSCFPAVGTAAPTPVWAPGGLAPGPILSVRGALCPVRLRGLSLKFRAASFLEPVPSQGPVGAGSGGWGGEVPLNGLLIMHDLDRPCVAPAAGSTPHW